MKVIRSFRKTITLRVKNSEVIVKAPFFMLPNQIKEFTLKHKDWIDSQLKLDSEKVKLSDKQVLELKKKAKEYIPARVEELAKKYSFKYNTIKITSAKTRWGSCTSKKNLNFSFYLIWAPERTIDYVIIHELSHLKHMNHSKKFRDLVESMIPDYKSHVKWLKLNWNRLIH